jgi:ribosomal protein S27AE
MYRRIHKWAPQTPKKIKHKRKKVKMSILKYYKVDPDGKIKRLRRECPAAECGAGVFVRPYLPMAIDEITHEF